MDSGPWGTIHRCEQQEVVGQVPAIWPVVESSKTAYPEKVRLFLGVLALLVGVRLGRMEDPMIRSLTITGLLLCALYAVAPPAVAQNISGDPVAGFGALEQKVLAIMQANHIPGVAIGVNKGGRLVYARGFGYAELESQTPVQPDSMFRLASVSKPITAAAVDKLVEEGKLAYDTQPFATIFRNLQPLPGGTRDPRLNQITVRQLMTHTAGWRRERQADVAAAARAQNAALPGTFLGLLRYEIGQPLDYTPGTDEQYCNFCYNVLAEVVQEISGVAYEDFVKQVLQQAGIHRTSVGSHLKANRLPGEVVYYDIGGQQVSSFYPDTPAKVDAPYGGYTLDWGTGSGAGAWVSNVPELLRLVSSASWLQDPTLFSKPLRDWSFSPLPFGTEGCGWNHEGGIPGTATTLYICGDTTWAILVNRGDANSLLQQLNDAVKSTVDQLNANGWPAGDQFAKFLGSRTLDFSNQRVTTAAPPKSTCAVPPAVTSFSTGDQTVYLYFEATVGGSDALTSDWVAPDGSIRRGATWDGAAAGRYCFTAALDITNVPSGQWQSRVYNKGTMLFSIPFRIGSSVLNFTSQRVTTAAPSSSSCAVPPSVTSFTPADRTVFLYFVATVSSTDTLNVAWVRPDNIPLVGDGWPNSSGTYCFSGGLNITNSTNGDFGNWQARVYNNGTLVFSVPFTISRDPGAAPSQPGAIANAKTINGTQFCIDVPNANYTQGVTLITWACHGGDNQQFTRTEAGELKIGGFCVDAYGGGHLGASIGLWPCHGGPNQKWALLPDGHYRGDGGFCIAPKTSTPSYATDLVMVTCENGNAGQLWSWADEIDQGIADPPAC